MSLKFVTIFPGLQNIHLRKGLGKIPYILHRDFGYDSTIVSFKNESHYPSLGKDIPGVKIQFFKFKLPSLIASVFYLLANAHTIDILNLYGQSRDTFFIGLIYKIMKPKGILFNKLDMNIQYVHNLKNSKNAKRHRLFWDFYFSKIATIVSSEYLELTGELLRFYKMDAQKIIQLPNGVDEVAISNLPFQRLAFQQKENIILAVGRIGIPEKNYEMLLAATTQLDLKDWKVVFVGPMEVDFKTKVEQFKIDYPHLIQNVQFVGAVTDFEELSRWYNSAKIFCLTSIREGFPVVLPEAMYWSNYIVTTPVSSIHEILDNGQLGSLVNNEKELVDVLQTLILHPEKMDGVVEKSTQKAEQQYIWTKLVAKLAHKIDSNISL